ncbi:MAG: hypothetical protein ACRD3W_25320, partial [Terriglobales bacterium]
AALPRFFHLARSEGPSRFSLLVKVRGNRLPIRIYLTFLLAIPAPTLFREVLEKRVGHPGARGKVCKSLHFALGLSFGGTRK